VLIAGNDGTIHKTTLNEQLTQEYASQVPALASLARNVVRDLDPQVRCCPARGDDVLVHSSWLIHSLLCCVHHIERLDIPSHQKPEARSDDCAK
jgi:hypothetical protein